MIIDSPTTSGCMKLSDKLKVCTSPANSNPNLKFLIAHAELLENAVIAMVQDGWLQHGVEGMDDAQRKCYEAYKSISCNSR